MDQDPAATDLPVEGSDDSQDPPDLQGPELEADQLARYLEGRRRRWAEQRARRSTLPPMAEQLLDQDERHLNLLSEALEQTREARRAARPGADLGLWQPPRIKKAPLPWRVVRVLWRRSVQALKDHRHAHRVRAFSKRRPTTTEKPDLSVIIPTFDRRELILKQLTRYEKQSSDLSFEILVVDDGSTDGTFEAVSKLRPERYRLRALLQENAGPAAARNLAVKEAEGRLIFITGDDIEPAEDLLLRHWQAHEELADPSAAVLGLIRWPAEGLKISTTMTHIDGEGAQQFNYAWLEAGREYDFRHFYTSNISLHRSMLMQGNAPSELFSNLFTSAAFEDAELAYRLSGHGLRIVYRPEAEALHHHPYVAGGFFKRQKRCGTMAQTLWHLHPELAPLLGLHALEIDALNLLRVGRQTRWRLWARCSPEHDRALYIGAAALDSFPPDSKTDPNTSDDFLKIYFQVAYEEGLARAMELPRPKLTVAWSMERRLPETARALHVRLQRRLEHEEPRGRDAVLDALQRLVNP